MWLTSGRSDPDLWPHPDLWLPPWVRAYIGLRVKRKSLKISLRRHDYKAQSYHALTSLSPVPSPPWPALTLHWANPAWAQLSPNCITLSEHDCSFTAFILLIWSLFVCIMDYAKQSLISAGEMCAMCMRMLAPCLCATKSAEAHLFLPCQGQGSELGLSTTQSIHTCRTIWNLWEMCGWARHRRPSVNALFVVRLWSPKDIIMMSFWTSRYRAQPCSIEHTLPLLLRELLFAGLTHPG